MNNDIEIWRWPLLLSGVLLCAISITASVLLWVSVPGELIGQWLAGVTALGLEISKFAFLPIGIAMWYQGKPIWSVAVSILGVVLLLLSIGASIGFLENSVKQQHQQVLQQSVTYRALQQQLKSIETRIQITYALIEKDMESKYRGRGYRELDDMPKLEKEREEIIAALKMAENGSEGEMAALINAMATQLSVKGDLLAFWLFTLLAIIVDLAAVAALALLGLVLQGEGKSNTDATADNQTTTDSVADTTPQPTLSVASETPAATPVVTARSVEKPKANTPQVQPIADARVERIRRVAKNIMNGVYGNPPIVREAMRVEGMDYRQVIPAFDALIAKGHLAKNGRDYQFAKTQETEA